MSRLGIADFAEVIDCQLRRIPISAAGREFYFCVHCMAYITKPANADRTPCPVAELVAQDLALRGARSS